jgi:hypothetical protein
VSRREAKKKAAEPNKESSVKGVGAESGLQVKCSSDFPIPGVSTTIYHALAGFPLALSRLLLAGGSDGLSLYFLSGLRVYYLSFHFTSTTSNATVCSDGKNLFFFLYYNIIKQNTFE